MEQSNDDELCPTSDLGDEGAELKRGESGQLKRGDSSPELRRGESMRSQRVRECYMEDRSSLSRNISGFMASPSRSGTSSFAQLNHRLQQLSLKNGDANTQRRRWVAIALYNPYLEAVIGIITIFNFVVILRDTDLKAAEESIPIWIQTASLTCLVIYSFELGIRVYVERWKLFEHNVAWNVLDIFVVSTGIISEVCEFLEAPLVNLTFLRVFRCFRLLRIFKAMVLARQLRELRKFIRGIISCMKTLLWGWVLVFLFMTMWSCLAVEMLNPYMKDVYDKTPAWLDCDRCERSFESIWGSNLTFFQTIVAGDSWGKVAIPVIELYPWTALIFMGSLFTLLVGILNLIVAVLVDTAAEARINDIEARAVESKYAEKREKKALERIFRQIDADQGGTVTLDELESGAEEVPEFYQTLRVMDIQGEDLQQLFMILDETGCGEVNPTTFIEQLYRLKCGDHKTASTFAKHYVVHMKKNQVAMLDKLNALEREIRSVKKGSLDDNSDSDVSNYAPVMSKEYGDIAGASLTQGRKRSRRPHKQKQLEELYYNGRASASKNGFDGIETPLPSPVSPERVELMRPTTPRTPQESYSSHASVVYGASAPASVRASPTVKDVRRSASSPSQSPRTLATTDSSGSERDLWTGERSLVSCLPGSRKVFLPRDLQVADDPQFVILEHQFMQERLIGLLDQAEKTLTSTLQQTIKANILSTKEELSELVQRDPVQDPGSSNSKVAPDKKSKFEVALQGLFETIDHQVTTSLHQALQPIRNWREIADWADRVSVSPKSGNG